MPAASVGVKKPTKSPPHDDDKQEKGFDHAGKRGDPLPERRLRRGDAEPGLQAGPGHDGEDEKNGEEDAGQDAGHEELAYGLFRHDPVDDEDRARRDEDPETAAGGHDPRRQGGIIPVFFHFGQGDGGHRGRCGGGRTADRGKSRAGPDRGDGESPRKVPQKLVGRVEKPTAEPRVVGYLPHKNEQGDDRQVIGTKDGEEVPCEQVQGSVPGDQEAEAEEADDGHDESHRDPDEHQDDENHEPQQAGRDGRHDFAVLTADRRHSERRTRQSSPLPAAIP